jgi:hypothetical protein
MGSASLCLETIQSCQRSPPTIITPSKAGTGRRFIRSLLHLLKYHVTMLFYHQHSRSFTL